MPGLLELLRPPPHRGPLIAAGAVLVTVGVALEEIRLADKLPTGVHLVILALASGRDLRARDPGRARRAARTRSSRCCWCAGCCCSRPALLTLADVLGADFDELPGRRARVDLAAVRRRRAVAGGRARLGDLRADRGVRGRGRGGGVRQLGARRDVAHDVPLAARSCSRSATWWSRCCCAARRRATPSRWSTPPGWRCWRSRLTGVLPALFDFAAPFGGGPDEILPNGWELVVFAAGCGLIAYGAVDRAPGPAYLGVANLLAFVVSAAFGTDEETLLYWPALILALGARRDVRRPAPAGAAAARAQPVHHGQGPARLAHRRGRAGAARAR